MFENLTKANEVALSAILLLIANLTLADASSTRLQTYKDNRLIPQNLTLTEGDTNVMFSYSTFSWSSQEGILKNLLSAYGDMSADEWKALQWYFRGDADLTAQDNRFLRNNQLLTQLVGNTVQGDENGAKIQEYLDYLVAVSNGEIVSAELSAADALQLRQNFITRMGYVGGTTITPSSSNFVIDGTGLDFTNASTQVSLGMYKNLTPEQFLAIQTKAPKTTDNPSVDISKILGGAFTGSEDFSNVNINNCDFSKVSSITGAQIAGSKGFWASANGTLPGVNLSAKQYADFLPILQGAIAEGETKTIRVDGVPTVITGTYRNPMGTGGSSGND